MATRGAGRSPEGFPAGASRLGSSGRGCHLAVPPRPASSPRPPHPQAADKPRPRRPRPPSPCPAMPADLSGTWNLLSCDNFEGYMLALGRAGLAWPSVSRGGRLPVPRYPRTPVRLPLLRPSRPFSIPPHSVSQSPRPVSLLPTIQCPPNPLSLHLRLPVPSPLPPSPRPPSSVPSPSILRTPLSVPPSFHLPGRPSVLLCPCRSLPARWPSLLSHRGQLRRRPPRRRTRGSDPRPGPSAPGLWVSRSPVALLGRSPALGVRAPGCAEVHAVPAAPSRRLWCPLEFGNRFGNLWFSDFPAPLEGLGGDKKPRPLGGHPPSAPGTQCQPGEGAGGDSPGCLEGLLLRLRGKGTWWPPGVCKGWRGSDPCPCFPEGLENVSRP